MTINDKEKYALQFVCDRLNRTLQYAESREGTNHPDIVTPIMDALTAAAARITEEPAR